MKDVDMAKELLEKEKLTLAIVKDGKLVFSSYERGIKPLYTAVEQLKNELEGSSVADKVTGKAAAMLCKYANIKELHTKLISENAMKLLNETSIVYEYDEYAPYIKNRDKTGMCPVETLSLEVHNINELLLRIVNFLESIEKVD
ncbi:MAG: DUF1893 domain-containing protein [Sedimentibacter sp.]|uniref:DUF1893 domain-containing protein n=1 Tax=Sedimentibacter sp. TaxID=1960295 RepID=UPI002980DF39|nr:DUF1893 domain-containing protein [Sedimentibacter sp.]MDW5298830.1 DUF1893 domain-containing protein [Sedimentibacter sp.]